MKVVMYIIWIMLIIIGAVTHHFIPADYQYLYGFIFGCFSLVPLQVAGHIDN